jgi:hypothetical protein
VAYLAMLEKRQKQSALCGSEDTAANIMDEWTDDEEIDSALDQHDPYGLLVLTMSTLQSSHPTQFQVCIPRYA